MFKLKLRRQRSCENAGYPHDWIDYDETWRFLLVRDMSDCATVFLNPVFFDYRNIWSKRIAKQLRACRSVCRRLRQCMRNYRDKKTLERVLLDAPQMMPEAQYSLFCVYNAFYTK